jgi:hypothetical protein
LLKTHYLSLSSQERKHKKEASWNFKGFLSL